MKSVTVAAGLAALGLAAYVALGQGTAIAQADPDPELFAALMEEGEDVYERKAQCGFCHGSDGMGAGAPRLAGNTYVRANASTVGIILGGYESHGMPAFRSSLTIREVAAVATYVRNSWGNDFGITTEATVGQYYNDAGSGL
jgi:mono/diheme cytochrome c family protein